MFLPVSERIDIRWCFSMVDVRFVVLCGAITLYNRFAFVLCLCTRYVWSMDHLLRSFCSCVTCAPCDRSRNRGAVKDERPAVCAGAARTAAHWFGTRAGGCWRFYLIDRSRYVDGSLSCTPFYISQVQTIVADCIIRQYNRLSQLGAFIPFHTEVSLCPVRCGWGRMRSEECCVPLLPVHRGSFCTVCSSLPVLYDHWCRFHFFCLFFTPV